MRANMPSLCDINVLLALAFGRHTHHRAATSWLATTNDAGAVVVCRQAQLGLLRLLSTRAVMGGDVLDTAGSWAVLDAMMSDERFAFGPEPPELELIFRQVMRGVSVSPKVWQDAYLAAFAIAGGLTLVTFDDGFSGIAGLELTLLG